MKALTASSGKIDWRSLLARSAERHDSFPHGFHDGDVLRRMIHNGQRVSGLVVSIGVITSCDDAGSMPDRVTNFIQSLIGPGDFACPWSQEGFVLICPGELGASAQRRLGQICRQLWDFQLRSLGDLAILFSWGGVEVPNESADEAVTLATMRMQETWRARKALMAWSKAGELKVGLTSPAACLS